MYYLSQFLVILIECNAEVDEACVYGALEFVSVFQGPTEDAFGRGIHTP